MNLNKKDITSKTPDKKMKPREVHHPIEEKKEIKKVATQNQKGLVQDMSEKNTSNSKSIILNIVVSLVVVILGVFSGWGLSEVLGKPAVEVSAEEKSMVKEDEISVGSKYGNTDTEAFTDNAEGVLLKGGLDGEGSHRLLRPGGETQTVYLTSSVVDLDPLVGHKVKVWGDTFAAQKANWLMDVGIIEVVELDAPKPFEEE